MGFLDNSGDIILDAVLTDHGRKILAKGDGSFKITKFAVGDEEIDYGLYNKNHNSGSAYYDLEILQTPVLEAFTNNASSMKTKLVSYDNERLLYLPVIKLNTNFSETQQHSSGSFFIACDRETEGTDGLNGGSGVTQAVGTNSDGKHVTGILFGASFESSGHIRLDQGIDSSEISPQNTGLMQGMIDSSYIIQMDHRLGSLRDLNGSPVPHDHIDDDDIAYYVVRESSLATLEAQTTTGLVLRNTDTTNSSTQAIQGPRGSMLRFKVAASIDLMTNNFLFNKLGSTALMSNKAGAVNQSVRTIDTMIRITGMQSGYSIDVPVRYIKTIL